MLTMFNWMSLLMAFLVRYFSKLLSLGGISIYCTSMSREIRKYNALSAVLHILYHWRRSASEFQRSLCYGNRYLNIISIFFGVVLSWKAAFKYSVCSSVQIWLIVLILLTYFLEPLLTTSFTFETYPNYFFLYLFSFQLILLSMAICSKNWWKLIKLSKGI